MKSFVICREELSYLGLNIGGGFRLGTSTMYMKAFISWIEKLKDNGLNAIIMSVKYRKCLQLNRDFTLALVKKF